MQGFTYTDGYVRIKIWGSNIERFFNMCARKKMLIWDVEAHGKYIYANMLLRDFYQCRQLARKTGIRAVVVERHGLPFFLPKIFKRSFMLIGCLIFLIIWLVSTNMILHVELEGNYSISEDIFKDFLEMQNIRIGMWKKDVSLEELEKEIRKNFDLITWTSGKIDGTVLTINIKENEKLIPDKTNSLEYGSDIYASADGIVSSILVRYGIPMVKEGMEVKKGDLLVSGQVPIFNEAQEAAYYQYYESDADIMIETDLDINLNLSKVYISKEYTGRKTKGNYFFINDKIYRNTWKDKDFIYRDYVLVPKSRIHVADKTIGIGTYNIFEYKNIEKEYSKSDAEGILLQEFEKNNSELIQKGVQILEKDVTIDIIMDKWVLSGVMRVIMPAVIHKPIEIPEDADGSESI